MPANSSVQTIIDISTPVHPNMPVFPGDPGITFEPALDMDCGAPANVTHIHIGSQTGTHFDTPHHILNNGQTVDTIPLEWCYGPAQVIEIPGHIQAIDGTTLQSYNLNGCERLLLKTRNSQYWHSHPDTFVKTYAALTGDGAKYLADIGIKLVGIDYLSIEIYDTPDLPAHKILLTRNIIILEGLDLSQVIPGWYTLAAFPIKYRGLDGAPTRAVLLT